MSDDDEETRLMCMPNGPSEFTDNLVGSCSMCGREIMYRPHAPMGIKKVCVYCVAAEAPADVRHMVTRETAREVAAWRRKQLN